MKQTSTVLCAASLFWIAVNSSSGDTQSPRPRRQKIQQTAPRPLSKRDAALLNAVRRADVRSVRNLLRQAANAKVKDQGGNPILTLAVERKQKVIAKLLLDHGAAVDTPNAAGATALLYAIGQIDLLKL